MEPQVRTTKRQAIFQLFVENIGRKFSSHELHAEFGSAFRSRVSDINRLASSPIRIVNHTASRDRGEISFYWSVLKHPTAIRAMRKRFSGRSGMRGA